MLLLLLLADFFDAAAHVKVAFADVVVFAFEDFLESFNGVRDWNLFAFAAGENLRDGERLAQEALHLARAGNGEFVVGRQFIHTENRDDVLEILVALQDLLNATSDFVMFLADNFRREGARAGSKRIDSRE